MRRSWQGLLVLFLAVGPLFIHPWVHPSGDTACLDALLIKVPKGCGHSHVSSLFFDHSHDGDHEDEEDSEQGCGHDQYCSLCAARCESIPLDLTSQFLVGWLGSISHNLITAQQPPPFQWLDWPQPLSRRGPPRRLS